MKWVFDGSFLRSFYYNYYLNFVNWCQTLVSNIVAGIDDIPRKSRLLVER